MQNQDTELTHRIRVSQPNTTDLQAQNIEETKNGAANGVHIAHESLDYEPGWLESHLSRMGEGTGDFVKHNRRVLSVAGVVVVNALILAFFAAALVYYLRGDDQLELCHGFGSLIAFFSIIYFFVIYFKLVKRFFGKWFNDNVWVHFVSGVNWVWKYIWFRWCFTLVVLVALAVFLWWDTQGGTERLVSLLGLGILLLLGFVFSSAPGRVRWGTVIAALALQFAFGLLFIRWDAGRLALQCFSDKVATFLSYGTDGAAFAYGDLLVRTEGVFAFASLPVIFFFSMMVEVLFYLGALQWFCLKLGHLLRAATGTTVCESVICVGNIFLGMTESALLIKPYIALLTPSEIHIVMASGFATVSGTILAAYIQFGARAEHLVTASVMSAPAAVCFAKLLMPETKRSLTTVDNIQTVESDDQSVVSAATRGATNGVALVMNIIANIIAFVAFIAFVNGVFGYFGGLIGYPGLTLEWLMGKILMPLCWTMGVPWAECTYVAELIGLKTVVNEFVAYQRMGVMKDEGLLSPRGELIATYSLCGFTNPASAGIMIGAMSSMAPNQRETLAAMSVRAFFAGCGICFMTACIAGLLMPEGSFV